MCVHFVTVRAPLMPLDQLSATYVPYHRSIATAEVADISERKRASMFSINMEDVYKMLETMRGQLIALGVILALAIIITVAVNK